MLVCTLIHNVRILEKKYNTVLCNRYEKDALQEKKEVVRGSVQGIFQTGGMTGIEALKCLGPEDKTRQRTEESLFNSWREPHSSVIMNCKGK